MAVYVAKADTQLSIELISLSFGRCSPGRMVASSITEILSWSNSFRSTNCRDWIFWTSLAGIGGKLDASEKDFISGEGSSTPAYEDNAPAEAAGGIHPEDEVVVPVEDCSTDPGEAARVDPTDEPEGSRMACTSAEVAGGIRFTKPMGELDEVPRPSDRK